MYKIEKFIDEEDLISLNWVAKNLFFLQTDAQIISASSPQNAGVSKNVRKTSLIDLPVQSLENYSNKIEKYFDKNGDIITLQHNLLIYKEGDFFIKHIDSVPKNFSNFDPQYRERKWSVITLIDKSEDLEGGDLLLYKNNESPIKIDLKIGETVIFLSKTLHEVTPVIKGTRKALISWFGFELPSSQAENIKNIIEKK